MNTQTSHGQQDGSSWMNAMMSLEGLIILAVLGISIMGAFQNGLDFPIDIFTLLFGTIFILIAQEDESAKMKADLITLAADVELIAQGKRNHNAVGHVVRIMDRNQEKISILFKRVGFFLLLVGTIAGIAKAAISQGKELDAKIEAAIAACENNKPNCPEALRSALAKPKP